MVSTRIIKKVDYFEYKSLIERYKNKIEINPHSYFRLNQAQRKVYKNGHLINMLKEEKPSLIGIQQNERYAAFFRRKEGFLRIIFQINKDKNIEIITFFITDNLPNI